MSKRIFDVLFALILLLFLGALLLLCIILASIDTNSFGLFRQERIGRYGHLFTIFKIKSLNDKTKSSSKLGRFLRSTKLDELPQLINILLGTMSFVGPRPDISGYADKLKDNDKIILNVRPGVTGLASLKYRNEEEILVQQDNPLQYNDNTIWPDKVRINKWYVENRTTLMDLKIIFHTLLPLNFDVDKFINDY